MIRKKLISALLFSVGLFFISSVSSFAKDSEIDIEKTKSDWDTPAVKPTIGGYYHTSIKSIINPLTINQFHSWVVHIETPDGKAVENANIQVSGGMPDHKHGFPTSPRITKYSGNGDYLLEGVKFSMPGLWVLSLKIKAAGKTDKVSFEINL